MKQIKTLHNILGIVELILYFNKLYQSGQWIKILTPSHMLSRLPISLAQLQAGNNSDKMKLRYYFVLCTDQKNLQNKPIKVWLRLFKTWKQFLWILRIIKQVNHTDLN